MSASRKRPARASTPGRETRFWRVALPILAALAVWGIGMVGLLEPIVGPTYDTCLRLRAGLHDSESRVLLIEVDRRASAAQVDLHQLLELLLEHDAQQVVFALELDPYLDRDVLELGNDAKNVVFAIPMSPLLDGSDRFERAGYADSLEPNQGAAISIPGAIFRPPVERGVHRRQTAWFPTREEPVAGIEVAATRALLGSEFVPDEKEFWVDFRGGPGSLPHLDARRALAGELIPELVRRRTVLVGEAHPATTVGLSTPTTEGIETLSLLEYRGQALNTLLTGRRIRSTGPAVELLLLLLLAITSIAIDRWLSLAGATVWTLGGLVGVLVMGALLFVQAGIWIPIPQLALVLGLSFFGFLRSRVTDLTSALDLLLLDVHRRLPSRALASAKGAEEPPWALIGHMIDQTLDLNRLIFLEANPESPQLEVALALHCSVEDLTERRLSHDREPYTNALEAKGLLRVRHLFRENDPDEEQHLIPIGFAGELLGFWALGINTFKADATPRFQEIVRHFTQRTAEILYEARRQHRRSVVHTLLSERLLPERHEQTRDALASALTTLGNRHDTLQNLVDQLESAVIVYDVFGRLTQINTKMLELLNKEKIKPFQLSAFDLLLSITDVDPTNGRKVIRKALVDGAPTTFTLELESQPSAVFQLQVKPLTPQEDEDEEQPLSMQGMILFELLDTTSANRFSEMRSSLSDRFLVQMRRDLSTIDLSASLLSSLELPADHCQRMGGLIQKRVTEAVQAVSDCQQYLCAGEGTEELERFPIDPLPIIRAAVTAASEDANKKGVEIKLWEPGVTRYLLASTIEFRFLLKSLLSTLVNDAAEDSIILVRFGGDDSLVAIDFSNSGVGIPNQALQEYLHGEDPVVTEEMARLRQGAAWVEEWGGILEAVSDVGIGIHFTIHLARFL